MTAAEVGRIPLSRMRRAIARSMTASALVPQFTLEWDVTLAAVTAWRQTSAHGGERISVTDVMVAAAAHALRAHPGLNASFAEDAIVQHAEVNVALAFALKDGLIAPAIRRADERTIPELVGERERLRAAAEDGTLTPEELFSATFTISNLGPLGVHRFRALVVPPQAAILALGAAGPDGMLTLSLSCDHRVVDGAPAARFLAELAGRLERPEWLDELVAPRS